MHYIRCAEHKISVKNSDSPCNQVACVLSGLRLLNARSSGLNGRLLKHASLIAALSATFPLSRGLPSTNLSLSVREDAEMC